MQISLSFLLASIIQTNSPRQHGNLVLSTKLKMLNGHLRELSKLMFRALALHQSKICCLTLKYNWRRSDIHYVANKPFFLFSKGWKRLPRFLCFQILGTAWDMLAMGPKLHLQDLIGLRQ